MCKLCYYTIQEATLGCVLRPRNDVVTWRLVLLFAPGDPHTGSAWAMPHAQRSQIEKIDHRLPLFRHLRRIFCRPTPSMGHIDHRRIRLLHHPSVPMRDGISGMDHFHPLRQHRFPRKKCPVPRRWHIGQYDPIGDPRVFLSYFSQTPQGHPIKPPLIPTRKEFAAHSTMRSISRSSAVLTNSGAS